MDESRLYVQLLKKTLINDENTQFLIKEGYIGEYDPLYITKKGEQLIAEFEKKLIAKVTGYLGINGSITLEKLRDITALEPDAFALFLSRVMKKHKLIKKKIDGSYVLRKRAE